MDNDAKILQKARDLYKGLRFGWRYRGVELMLSLIHIYGRGR